MPTLFRTTLFCLLVAAMPVSAQSYGNAKSGFSERTTNKVVRLLERGLKQCQAIDKVYRYDCYRQNYQSAARQLAGNPAYAPAQRALQEVEGTLETVLRKNADPAASQIRRKGKTFSAITPAATPKAKEAFRTALDQASTQLLRSSTVSGDHLARIASVLDSEKVFLRS